METVNSTGWNTIEAIVDRPASVYHSAVLQVLNNPVCCLNG